MHRGAYVNDHGTLRLPEMAEPVGIGRRSRRLRGDIGLRSAMLFSMTITFEWRGAVGNEEINRLHAEGFDHAFVEVDWTDLLSRLSLGWVTARDAQGLVGFVNVIWDGQVHAFIEDTLVADRARRQGIGKRLLAVATEHSKTAGCEWLHVDFDDHLRSFYFDACGFRPTNAGLIQLR